MEDNGRQWKTWVCLHSLFFRFPDFHLNFPLVPGIETPRTTSDHPEASVQPLNHKYEARTRPYMLWAAAKRHGPAVSACNPGVLVWVASANGGLSIYRVSRPQHIHFPHCSDIIHDYSNDYSTFINFRIHPPKCNRKSLLTPIRDQPFWSFQLYTRSFGRSLWLPALLWPNASGQEGSI